MFLTFLQNTDLRDNLTYLKWYGMIGSTLIMVLIPAVVLIWSAFAMCMGIPEGNQRKKIVRIMIIIIAMFIICHVPKVSRRVKGDSDLLRFKESTSQYINWLSNFEFWLHLAWLGEKCKGKTLQVI